MSEYRVPVFESEQSFMLNERVIARVRYNSNLDYHVNGHFQNGGVGMHKGLTRLRDGRYVIIIGSNWQGSKDYAYVVSANEALDEIIKSGNAELLELKKFSELKKIAADLDEMEMDDDNDE